MARTKRLLLWTTPEEHATITELIRKEGEERVVAKMLPPVAPPWDAAASSFRALSDAFLNIPLPEPPRVDALSTDQRACLAHAADRPVQVTVTNENDAIRYGTAAPDGIQPDPVLTSLMADYVRSSGVQSPGYTWILPGSLDIP